MAEKCIEVEGFGTVIVALSARSKHIRLSINRELQTVITLPPHGRIEDGISFLRKNAAWIAQARQKVANRVAQKPKTIFTEETEFKTRSFQLKIAAAPRDNMHLSLSEGVLTVQYPQKYKVTSPSIQKAIRFALDEAFRVEAKNYLPGRLSYLAQLHGFKYSGVTIKNVKSKWGSCSSRGQINLNLHLMRLPNHLIDFILLHELCHTVEMNHGDRFHKLLNKCVDGHEARYNRELKNFNVDY